MADNQDEDLGEEIIVIEEEGGEESEQTSAAPEDDDSELEQYSKGVQKRISRLTEKFRKEERDREEAVRIAQQLLQEKQQLEGRLKQLDSGYLNEYGARIEAQITSARRAYKDAYEAGDTDRMIEAQEALARATTDKDRYDLAKRRSSERVQTEAPQAQPQYTAQAQPTQQQQAPQVDPRAQGWAEKNTWFGQDEVMTYAAFGIHRKLVEEEGFDPQSDEYYSEIDRRVRAEFPHKFKTAKTPGKSQVAPAGSSASRSTKQGRRTVKLSPSQIAIAKRLNVPLEEYAKYVKD
jgi:pyruvate/2-oxoglutarate dehydrogenase complex dihydrolipoamide acyltransferase (E2) component